MEYTDEQINAAPALLAEFLEGMPEIVVDQTSEEFANVGVCYDGDSHAYIKESFNQFLDQVHC